MKREEALKQLEIMNAWAAGKTIQFRLKQAPWIEQPEFKDYGGTKDESPAVFNTESYEWRIKPDVLYFVCYPDRDLVGPHTDQDEAERWAAQTHGASVRKFIEVIE